MSIRFREVSRSLTLFGVLGLASSPAFALVTYLDTLTVNVDGSLFGQDTFSDGIPPPSGPYGSDTYAYVKGTMTEAGGKLRLDTSLGGLATNVFGQPARIQRATAKTDATNDPGVAGLKLGHTFSATATYDLVPPALMNNGESYSLRFVDRDDTGIHNDMVMLVVNKNDIGDTYITFQKNNFINHTQTVFGSVTLDSVTPAGADQISLMLSDISGDQNITASYSFLQAGSPIIGSGGTFASTAAIFHGENWTRPEFSVSTPVPEPEIWAMMIAGCGLMGLLGRRRKQ